MTDRITVIVTVWNRTEFLQQALESVLSQTQPPGEIIVTDDSDSPAIRALCERPGNPLIRYRANTVQLGTAGNVTAALAGATGEWVAILNDDDAWEPELLARLSAPLRENRHRVLAFGDHSVMNGAGEVLARESDESSARFGRDQLNEGEIANLAPLIFERFSVPIAVASLWRRDVVTPERMLSQAGPMYDFWIASILASTGRPTYYIPQRLARYRQHATMETNRFSPDRAEPAWHIYHELRRLDWFPLYDPQFLERQRAAAIRCGVDHLSVGLASEGRRWLAQAAELGGGFKLGFLRMLGALPAPLAMRLIHAMRDTRG